ncbi:MAG TPA: hypothetical protein PJ983_01285, partial [Flavobacteriales bacterium]|nr:hypothetical protein [Flavobacteriales bacterium]
MRLSLLILSFVLAIRALLAGTPENPAGDPGAFVGSFRMGIHIFKKGTQETTSTMDIMCWSTGEKLLYEVTMPNGQRKIRMLTDLVDDTNYALIEQEGGAHMAMRIKRPEATKPGANDGERPRITVTQEMRTIGGRTCTKVIAENAEGTWTGWVAMELKSPFVDMARAFEGQAAQRIKHVNAEVPGFPLEYEWVPATGEDR